MIDKQLPEPELKECVYCGRTKRLRGILIHWPSEYYDDENDGDDDVTFFGNKQGHRSFSEWSYICAWCRGIETKRRKKEVATSGM